MGRARLFAVVVLVVLSGCTLPGTPGQLDTDRELGYVGTYAHDDVFAFDGSDGLTEDELEAVTYRSMARIEVIRGTKFERDVEVDVVSRAQYRERRSDSPNASAFENELWRGTFLVDGETDPNRAFDELYGDAVAGYYTSDRVVLVTDDSDRVRVDRRTLVHELTHALQDQRFGLGSEGETIDERRAENGLIEGEANYVPYLYDQRCGEQWQCVADLEREPDDADELEERPFNVGLFLSIFAPYSEGPAFVAHLHETGGWEAVDRAHDERPTSTSQLIHPERYPDDRPLDVDVPDRSSDDWTPSVSGGEPTANANGEDDPRTETVGEATLYATIWANDVVDRPLTEGGTELSPYNYTSPATTGWAGDSFRVYEDVDDPDRTGHVWKLAWETPDDADAFADAYRTLLENRGADRLEETDDGAVYAVPDDEPFAGAYRVTTSDALVEIVGAPTVDDLAELHAAADDRALGSDDAVDAPTVGSSDAPTAGSAVG
ncbi:Hvo_1808 family surface protein [Natrarchaeobius oligotrophus]|uniref:Hvo_1808 family surface protein n=1 Tax=Natrarchaeobius oligotrophus TaxID=3455743 RepID=UPI001A9D370A|nr:Hvo_1808 family surface protein [Natrarchaeobius chitinivorans]